MGREMCGSTFYLCFFTWQFELTSGRFFFRFCIEASHGTFSLVSHKKTVTKNGYEIEREIAVYFVNIVHR